jgi:hypothetical protein
MDNFLIQIHHNELKNFKIIFKEILINPVKYLNHTFPIYMVKEVQIDSNKLIGDTNKPINLSLIAKNIILNKNYNANFFMRIYHGIDTYYNIFEKSNKMLTDKYITFDRYNFKITKEIYYYGTLR